MINIPEDVLFKVSLEAGLTPCKGSWIGTPEQVKTAAEKLGLTAKEYCERLGAHQKAIINELTEHWKELIKTVHHAFEYGFHCNDMTHGEIEEDISFALNKFAKENGLPVHDWDTDYEEQYGETQAD